MVTREGIRPAVCAISRSRRPVGVIARRIRKSKNLCRLMYGVASLPLGTPVELEIIFEVVGY